MNNSNEYTLYEAPNIEVIQVETATDILQLTSGGMVGPGVDEME